MQVLFDGSGWGCFVGVSMLVVVVKGKLCRRPFPRDGAVTNVSAGFRPPRCTYGSNFHKDWDNRLCAT